MWVTGRGWLAQSGTGLDGCGRGANRVQTGFHLSQLEARDFANTADGSHFSYLAQQIIGRDHYRAATACCCLFFWLDGANSLVSLWNGDGGLLTLLARSSRLAPFELASLVEADLLGGLSSSTSVRATSLWRDRGRSVRPAARVVVVVLTLRWPTLPVVGVGLTAPARSCSARFFFDLLLTE